MPRAVKRKPLPDPVAVIDLTHESTPSSATFRLPRSRPVETASSENWDVIPVPFECDIENDQNQRRCNRKRPKCQSTTIINLDETINVEDSPRKQTKTQSPVQLESPKSKPLNCPICLENLADDKIKAMTTPCGHVFCFDCLKIITQSKKKCSLCQRAITFSKCIRLHI